MGVRLTTFKFWFSAKDDKVKMKGERKKHRAHRRNGVLAESIDEDDCCVKVTNLGGFFDPMFHALVHAVRCFPLMRC